MRKMRLSPMGWVFIFLLVSTVCTAEDLPYRKDYPDVNVVELAELKAGYDNDTFMLVDVRGQTA